MGFRVFSHTLDVPCFHPPRNYQRQWRRRCWLEARLWRKPCSYSAACAGIRQKPRAHMHLPWPDKARSRPPESRRGSGREEAIGAAHAASFGFILRRMMPHFSPCISRLSSAETMQHEIAELSAVLGHGALWGLSIRRAQEGSAGWGVGWHLKSDGSIIWQRWRVAAGCGW